jgi:hypothetical protein
MAYFLRCLFIYDLYLIPLTKKSKAETTLHPWRKLLENCNFVQLVKKSIAVGFQLITKTPIVKMEASGI